MTPPTIKIWDHFSHPKILFCSFPVHSQPPAPGYCWSAFYHYWLNVSSLEFHTESHRMHSFVSGAFYQHNGFWESPIACLNSSFILLLSIISLYEYSIICLFLCPLMGLFPILGCFQLKLLLTKLPQYLCISLCVTRAFISLEWLPRSQIAGSYSKGMFNFIGNCMLGIPNLSHLIFWWLSSEGIILLTFEDTESQRR